MNLQMCLSLARHFPAEVIHGKSTPLWINQGHRADRPSVGVLEVGRGDRILACLA